MIRIAICDDEKQDLDREEQILREVMRGRGEACVVHRYSSGEELLAMCPSEEYEIIFLDISMGGMNGIQTAGALREQNPRTYIVFVTSYIDYAVEGYRVEAFRFILKDGMEESIPECVSAILQKKRVLEKIMHYSFAEGELELPLANLYYIENYEHDQIFHVREQGTFREYHLRSRMDLLEEELRDLGFLRIQRGIIVNICKVKRIEKYELVLHDCPIRFTIPRDKFRAVKGTYLERLGKMR